jgi:ubiquinone/menaquinone biosynthesis C-methylase UbiE/DNA-binding transcriptional ArsR family regulator
MASASNGTVLDVLRVLGDPTRLRILALLAQAELAVGELARALGMSQSRVSNHLKILRDADLLVERRAGSFSYCRLNVPTGAPGDLWRALSPGLEALDERKADNRRLAAVLADRADSRSFFDRIAGDWDLIGSDFARGTGRLEAISCLAPRGLVVADVGCGTGYLSRALARRVARVICVDTSAAMLDKARENLRGVPAALEFRPGSMEQLPLADGEVDAAFAHMVLHHLTDMAAGLREMVRVVRPGGEVVCVELLPHHESWMHDSMADTRLGVDPAALAADFRSAGLPDPEHEILDDAYLVEHPSGRKISLPLFLMRGRRAAPPS